MRIKYYKLFIIPVIIFLGHGLSGQGIQRSNSIGLRIGFWDILGSPTVIKTQNNSQQVDIKLGGAGAYICFTSRAFENLFFEIQAGGISGVEVYDDKLSDSSDVYVETMIPFLFGLRYDYLGSRLRGSIHPFISLGAGPYWLNKVKSIKEFDETQKTEVKNDFLYGGYLATGMNIMVSSRFVLNFDIRYQFIEFNSKNDYSGPEFIFGFNYMWGKKKEIFEIKDIKLIVKDIYPAYYQFYNLYPVALISVKNKISKPIDVRVISRIRGSSTKSVENKYYKINGGETVDIPVKAIFGRELQSFNKDNNASLNFDLEVRATQTFMKEISTPIVIHPRNAWNGDIDKLKYFITAENDIIRQYTREIIFKSIKENEEVSDFDRARIIFNTLYEDNIRYLPDPNIPFYKNDRVQYAVETLQNKSGDCDDLVILYSSLLESVGIKTAFIEVRDPDKEIAHVYLIFDSGLTPEQGQLISTNEKRYIIRGSERIKKKLWIPVETTLVEKGFNEAWQTGALSYLEEAVLKNGICDGWIRVIDINQ